ncbi:hypothetical protein [Sutcliffiella cohnii]|uniref:hypothetical protein n=1 Tax=Sutcliffiella cohnii TaxID=33932 RepID=UPI002E1F9DB5|nr:hypothetical protein [Sutcliffiella cohnii]
MAWVKLYDLVFQTEMLRYHKLAFQQGTTLRIDMLTFPFGMHQFQYCLHHFEVAYAPVFPLFAPRSHYKKKQNPL